MKRFELHTLNMGRFVIVGVLISALFSIAYSQVTVSASSYTGAPGDKITFTWSFSGSGSKYVVFDGIRKDDAFINSGSYTWTAEPGTHLMNVILRPSSGGDHIEKQAVVEISGNDFMKFTHPGVYNSQVELEQIKKNVNITGTSSHPMRMGWDLMQKDKSRGETGSKKYVDLSWSPHAVAIVNGKTMSEKWGCFEDGRAAYAHALQWVVTGEQKYADKSIEILNDWGSKFKNIETADHYIYLLNSWVSHTFMAGAEIIRHYKINGQGSGWKEADIAKFEDVARVFEKILLRWQGSDGLYNGLNQPAAVARSIFAVAVFLSDPGLFKVGTDFLFEYKHTKSEITNFHNRTVNLVEVCIADDGECMELNRDYGHGTGTHNATSGSAEIIRQQIKNIDPKYSLFGYRSSDVTDKYPRMLLGSEYVANTQINNGSGLSLNPNSDRNGRKGHYQEFNLNYYKHIDKNNYPTPNMEKVIKESRKTGGIAYTAAWTILTHADLSKDIPVAVVTPSIKSNRNVFSVSLSKSKVLQVNYKGSDKNAGLKLFTLSGKLVKSAAITKGIKSVSLKGLNHGLYIVKLQAGDASETKKLLLK